MARLKFLLIINREIINMIRNFKINSTAENYNRILVNCLSKINERTFIVNDM